MGKLLSDDEVFGASSGELLSDDEVFGSAKKSKQAQATRSNWETALDLVKLGTGSVVKGIAGIPEGIEQSAKGVMRQFGNTSDTGLAAGFMPSAIYTPSIDDSNDVTTQQERDALALKVDRTISAMSSIPGAKTLAGAGDKAQKYIKSTVSEPMQTAIENSTPKGNIFKGELSFGKDPSLLGYLGQGAEVAGSLVPVIGATLATKAPMVGAAVGGAMAAEEGASSATEFIAKKTDAELLAESPYVAGLVKQGVSVQEARKLATDKAAQNAALFQGIVAGVGDKLTGGLVLGQFDKAIAKVAGKSTLAKAGVTTAGAMGEEGFQEVSEGVVADAALHNVVRSKEIGEDSAGNLVLGALGGGAVGGGKAAQTAYSDFKDGRKSLQKTEQNEKSKRRLEPENDVEIAPKTEAKVSATETALRKSVELTALDRLPGIDSELNASAGRMAELTNTADYGPAFDGERTELQAKIAELQDSKSAITATFSPAIKGAKAQFSTEDGARLEGEYAVIAAADLVTSHDENLRANPLYPPELQPRDRSRSASEMQISNIVQKLDPARLGLSADAATGAPIVGADGLVESGNARSIALKRIYQADGLTADDYRNWLTQNAGQFGIAPESVASIENPVLVRIRQTPVNRAEFARQANASTVQRMSSSEQAVSDSKRLNSLDGLEADETGDFSASRGFIRQFMAALPITEQSDMIEADGRLSTNGYRRIQSAVMARAYGDSPTLRRMTESTDDNLRNISKALVRIAPVVAASRDRMKAGNLHNADLTGDLISAVEGLSNLRGRGVRVSDELSQGELGDLKYSPEARSLLTFLDNNIRSPRRIADFIHAYYDALESAGDPRQDGMFGPQDAPTKNQLLERAQSDGRIEGSGETSQRGNASGGTVNPQADSRSGQQPQDATSRSQSNEGNGSAGAEVGKWVAFAPDLGSLGIPRAEMPQVKSEHRSALLGFLAARGIDYETGEVPASSLKPTQAEYSQDKVDKFVETGVIGARSVLVSLDNHVLDGHHQWLGHLERNESIPIIRLNAPIKELLAVVNTFPSVKRSEGGLPDQRAEDSLSGQASMFNAPAEKPTYQGVESIQETSEKVFEGMDAAQHESEAKRIRKAAITMRQRGMPDVAKKYDVLAENHEIAAKKKTEVKEPVAGESIANAAIKDVAPKVGRFEVISVPDETTRWMGFEGRKSVKADLQALAQRHAEYYDSAQAVRADIDFVLGKPDGWYIHKHSKVVLFRERIGEGAIPQARVEVEAEADTMSVRSVYVGGKRQIAKKMADKRDVLSGLDLGGQSPDSLTIAEYLKVLGNGSSRPASPSGEVLKASESIAKAIPESKPDIRFSKGKNAGGLPATQVKSITDSIKAKWSNAPEIIVASNMDDAQIPQAVRDDNQKQLSKGAQGSPEGFLYGGKVYLIADQLSTPTDVMRVLFHETLGHVGLRGTFGDALNPILSQIVLVRRAEVAAKAKEYGFNMANEAERLRAAEEVLAVMAQTKPELGFVKRAVAAIRTWLRAHGINFRLTDIDIIANYILPARRFIEVGKQSAAPNAATDFSRAEQSALEELSKSDELFALPKSEKADIQGIADKNMPGIKVRVTDLVSEKMYTLTFPDGGVARITERPFNPRSAQLYGYTTKDGEMGSQLMERPGDNPDEAPARDDVWLDVSMLKPGKNGAFAYNIAATYAHNNGKVFIGDPAGLTDTALRRRTEQMISSALKFGTTDHLAPHPRQVQGDAALGVPPLTWVYGDSEGNLERMIEVSQKSINNAFPNAKLLAYNSDNGNFYRTDTGYVFPTRQDLARHGLDIAAERSLQASNAVKAEAGWRTLARHALYASLLEVDASQKSERGSLLDRLSRNVAGLGASGNGSGAYEARDRIFYSRANSTGLNKSAAERADDIIKDSVKSSARPLEAAAKLAAKVTGIQMLTRNAGPMAKAAIDRASQFISASKLDTLHEMAEKVKAGVVSDYGVPEAVIDRRTLLQSGQRVQLRQAQRLIDKLGTLTRSESRVAYEWMNMNGSDPKAYLSMMSGLPEESIAVLQDVQKMIDKLSLEAVRLGQLSADTYERHKFAYLRRSYAKHVLDATEGEKKKRAKSISVLGDQYKGRGIVEPVAMASIRQTAPEWFGLKDAAGKADVALKGKKFLRLEKRSVSASKPIEGMDAAQDGRVTTTIWWPADKALPAKYSEWTQAGEFEVRDTKGGNAIMWRDFTSDEREKMGEVDEARFAIAKTLQGMIHDVEVGRYLEWLGQKYAKHEGQPIPGKVIEASENMLMTFKPSEWVRVPKTTIKETDVLKYGKLADMYLPGPVWNDLRQIVAGSDFKPFGENYDNVLRMWKAAKTALSPAVHTNNIMSNMVMADWHDVRGAHMRKSLSILLGASMRDGDGLIGTAANGLARAGMQDAEAAREILIRYQDSGGQLGSWATNEIAKEQLEPMLAALRSELGVTEGGNEAPADVGVFAALQAVLSFKFPKAIEALSRMGQDNASTEAANLKKLIVTEGKSLIDLYQAEDEVFRLAAWLKAKEDGLSDIEAGKITRKSFLDYNINAPWIAYMRKTAWPFIAFTYRAVPMLLQTARDKPHKLLKLMALAGALNALGAMMAGDDDEDKRRKLLPEEKAGRVWGIVPKLIRMPWNDEHGSAVYLDIRRFIPVGDIADVGATHSALPMLPSLMPGGPLVILGELIANQSMFTGQSITKETDTAIEKVSKVMDHLYKALMPNLPLPTLGSVLPVDKGQLQTYSYNAIQDAANGKTDKFGRDLSLSTAAASAFGVKLGAYPDDVLRNNLRAKAMIEVSEVDKVISGLKRQRAVQGITDTEFQGRVQRQQAKKQKIMQELGEKMQ